LGKRKGQLRRLLGSGNFSRFNWREKQGDLGEFTQNSLIGGLKKGFLGPEFIGKKFFIPWQIGFTEFSLGFLKPGFGLGNWGPSFQEILVTLISYFNLLGPGWIFKALGSG